jgi:hypothetical protein
MRRVDRFPVPPGQSSDLFGYVAKWLVLLAFSQLISENDQMSVKVGSVHR